MFGLEFPDLLLDKGDCVLLEVLSRASAVPAMKIKVAASAIEEDNMFPVPTTFPSLDAFQCSE